jgi:hypothetical protein
MLKIGDKVKIKLDKVLDEYKKYDKVYEIVDIRIDNDDVVLYKLDGVPDWGTEDMIEKIDD